MALTSTAISAASAASQTVGAYFSAQNQRDNLNFQAGIADQNARIAELGARSATEAGMRQEQQTRLRTANLKSSQRAAMAANGIDLGSDTATNILSTTDVMGEIDANTVQANAIRSAWGYRTEGLNYTNQANMARATAGSVNPLVSAGGTLLTSAGNVASNWYALKKAGAFDASEANKASDPIYAMGSKRNWWEK